MQFIIFFFAIVAVIFTTVTAAPWYGSNPIANAQLAQMIAFQDARNAAHMARDAQWQAQMNAIQLRRAAMQPF